MQYFSQKSLEFKIKDIPLQPQTRDKIPGGTTLKKSKRQ